MGKVTFKKPSVIINMAAGSTSDISQDIKNLFEAHDYFAPAIHKADPQNLSKIFETVATDGTDLLVIYGGDGTCKSGAILARKNNIPLITLPGGTMNMLPRALYGTDDWKEALELALKQEKPRWCSGGKINDNVFFCGAILGDPIVMSEAREAVREGEILEAVKHIPDIMNAISEGQTFEFKVDGQLFDKDANVMHLSCPLMQSDATDADAFELASIPTLTVREMLGIGATALRENWRNSPHINITKAHQIKIEGQGPFDVLLDGEAEQVICPIEIKLEPKGVRVMAPDLQKGRS